MSRKAASASLNVVVVLAEGAIFLSVTQCIISAKFGQPAIKLAVMPGMGGSHRLTRLVGRAKAMEMCLTGRMMDAGEASAGMVSLIVPAAELVAEAIRTAETIAVMSLPATLIVKEAINRADEITLSEGLRFERRLFHSMFAPRERKEGITAFVDKRDAIFKHR